MSPASDPPPRTQPPPGGKPVVLYDGHCEFCTAQATRLRRIAGGRVLLRSFQDPGVLDDYPGLTHEHCMRELKMIAGDGRIFGGAEAFVRAVACGHRVIGLLLYKYYIPGIRQIADVVYRRVAARRYERDGRAAGECETGLCRRHGDGDQSSMER